MAFPRRLVVGRPRVVAGWLAAGCAAALAAGALVQYGLGHAPCSLCVLQRLGFVTALSFALPVAALPLRPMQRRVLAGVTLVAFLAGAGVAAYQVWLGFFPDGLARCGRGPAGYFEDTRLETLANFALDAAGDCGRPVTFFELVTMPQLGLTAYLLLAPTVLRLQRLVWSRNPARVRA
jgi:disulfide bond formation protein DsbB